MSPVKAIILVAMVILIVIQFFHPSRNVSNKQSPSDIAAVYGVPSNVETILKKACNDCHSNNTRYPWYANIQPVAWWLKNHIREGKRELNFNEFGSYRISKQYHKLESMIHEVKEGDMPLGSYTIIHTDARLTDDEKKTLNEWAQSIRDTIKLKYPADSLVRKK
jgi:hypothetical protein